jgi:hypothetical protein
MIGPPNARSMRRFQRAAGESAGFQPQSTILVSKRVTSGSNMTGFPERRARSAAGGMSFWQNSGTKRMSVSRRNRAARAA